MLTKIFLFTCSVSMISCNYCSEQKKITRKNFTEIEFNGLIDTFYFDEKDRNSPKIKVANKVINMFSYDINNYKVGDSVIKESGTLKIVLYKKGLQEPITLLPKCKGYEFE